MNPSYSIEFLGAAGTVTGSKHLFKTPAEDYLIDCGLFQGLKPLRLRNREPIPIEMSRLKAVLLTHAHLDHCGALPLLYRQGFRGPIYCTAPTRDLTEVILRDSARIQEEDAAIANKKKYSKHEPALPLYTEDDVEKTLPLIRVVKDGDRTELQKGTSFVFRPNGHILGSCFVELNCPAGTITFSGDVGRQESPLLRKPVAMSKTDYLVMESTYGDRLHPAVDPMDELADIILDTVRRKGNVLIPSFAVGRAQELMHMVNELKKTNRIPDLPVYMDSPMGANATEIFRRYPSWHKLSSADCVSLFEKVTMITNFEDTIGVIETPSPKIVIAASGMLTGGRVLYYLEKYIESKKNTILFTGYQSEGTRGRSLLQGAHEIKMHGTYYPVQAKVSSLSAMSGHGDQREMIEWLSTLPEPPKQVFLVHGEDAAREAFRVKLEATFGWNVLAPSMLDQVTLWP